MCNKMNLWDKIEERGRKVFNLDETWHLYAVDLDSNIKHGYADVEFAQKERGRYLTGNDVKGSIEYLDLE